MAKIASLLMQLVTVLVGSLPAAAAQVQAARTFVSGAGSDSNSCISVTAPCRHFTAAYAATAAGGEIVVLDPANYGAVTIGQALSIEGQGWAFVSAVSGAAAITINAGPTDKINIRGVVLDGGGIATTTGIQFNTGGSLHVGDSVIRNFTGNGVNFTPTAFSRLSVSNTLVSDNAGGIVVQIGSSGAMSGVLDRVAMKKNSIIGLDIESSTTSTVDLTVSDSVIAGNGAFGVFANSANGGAVNIMIRDSAIADNHNSINTAVGIKAENPGTQIWVTRSTIAGNDGAWDASGAVVSSFDDNNIVGNPNGNATPPPLAYK